MILPSLRCADTLVRAGRETILLASIASAIRAAFVRRTYLSRTVSRRELL